MSIPRHLISKLEEVFRGDKDVSGSPLQHLLKSNATPSDLEVITIRALLSEAEARIEDLHRRFPSLDRASKVKESQLLKIIETHRALLSPVRYLPSEILQEIFRHYANDPLAIVITEMPWRLGHISHRWREIALSLPFLWDNIPRIEIFHTNPKRFHVPALICLIRRSGTSPTLKFDLTTQVHGSRKEAQKSLVIKEIILHSERIEQLRIDINEKTMLLFQEFKGRLPNLRVLRVQLYALQVAANLDIFETAPALRHIAIGGACHTNHISYGRVLLPWSQITHFEDRLPTERNRRLVPLSSLNSLTYLDIHQYSCCYDESAIRFPYQPITLPNLRTLKLDCDYENPDLFLESLTIPAVEVINIFYCAPLIPLLVSMFSGSRGPSRLQKLTFRTIPLQTGELSALLKLTPHLVELDIDAPPVGDLLNLTYGMGEVILVPMLQSLHMFIPEITAETETEHFHTLAQVRCELPELDSRKDSEDATMPSLEPRTRTTLDTLRFVFESTESRDKSQKILNNWSFSFTPEEDKAIDMISRIIDRIISRCSYFPSPYRNYVPDKSNNISNNATNLMLDQYLTSLEDDLASLNAYEVTNKVLLVRLFFWILSYRISTLI